MKNPIIGIKIADGSYFPIMEEGSSKRKRLVLTTVNDNQESVQIDLYKGTDEKLTDAAYVGSLLIENIVQGPKESSEIELKLGFDNDGTLNAEAGDPGTGQYESLSISMETLSESAKYDTPEFSLDDDMEDLQIDNLDDFDSMEEEVSIPELTETDDEDLDFDDLEEEPATDLTEVEDEEIDLSLDDFDSMEDEISVSDTLGAEHLDEFDVPLEEEDDLNLDSDDLSLDDEDFDFDDIEEEPVPEQFDDLTVPLAEGDENLTESEDEYTPGLLSESEMVHSKEKKNGNFFLVALFVLIAIAAVAGISYLLFRSLQGEDSPVLEAQNKTLSTDSGEGTESKADSEESVVLQEKQTEEPEIIAENSAQPTESANAENQTDETSAVPEITQQENNKIQDITGVWYKIRWGDTLWGISYSFYNSPKDYNEIVKENKIKNPDLIFAETEIFIPSR